MYHIKSVPIDNEDGKLASRLISRSCVRSFSYLLGYLCVSFLFLFLFFFKSTSGRIHLHPSRLSCIVNLFKNTYYIRRCYYHYKIDTFNRRSFIGFQWLYCGAQHWLFNDLHRDILSNTCRKLRLHAVTK